MEINCIILTQLKKFYQNGFVQVEQLLIKEKSIKLKHMDKIKNKFLSIKNKNMHLTKDKKFNTIHDINKFIKKGKILSLSKDKRLIKIVQKIIGKR